MPKYQNLHTSKPEINRLIYWMGPDMKDVLGWFRGNLRFDEVERKFPGYVPKWWYYAEEFLNISDPLSNNSAPEKPKKSRRVTKADPPEPALEDNGEFF